MKTYFKNTRSVNIMIDSDNKKAIVVQYSEYKIISVITDIETYNRLVEDCANTTRWIVSEQAVFDFTLSQVLANI
jgi:hypothetical protein